MSFIAKYLIKLLDVLVAPFPKFNIRVYKSVVSFVMSRFYFAVILLLDNIYFTLDEPLYALVFLHPVKRLDHCILAETCFDSY